MYTADIFGDGGSDAEDEDWDMPPPAATSVSASSSMIPPPPNPPSLAQVDSEVVFFKKTASEVGRMLLVRGLSGEGGGGSGCGGEHKSRDDSGSAAAAIRHGSGAPGSSRPAKSVKVPPLQGVHHIAYDGKEINATDGPPAPADGKGIAHWLARNRGAQGWSNPVETKQITVQYYRSGAKGDVPVDLSSFDVGKPSDLLGDRGTPCSVVGSRTARIDFNDYEVRPFRYALRHGSAHPTVCITTWRLEASGDGEQWDTLSRHKDDQSLMTGGFASASWDLPLVPNVPLRRYQNKRWTPEEAVRYMDAVYRTGASEVEGKFYRYFRLTGCYSPGYAGGKEALNLSGFEVWGDVRRVGTGDDRKMLLERFLGNSSGVIRGRQTARGNDKIGNFYFIPNKDS